jgi:hypothetical protein
VEDGRRFQGSLPSAGGVGKQSIAAKNVKVGLGKRVIDSGRSVLSIMELCSCLRCNIRADEPPPPGAMGAVGGTPPPSGGGGPAGPDPADDDDFDTEYGTALLADAVAPRILTTSPAIREGGNEQRRTDLPPVPNVMPGNPNLPFTQGQIQVLREVQRIHHQTRGRPMESPTFARADPNRIWQPPLINAASPQMRNILFAERSETADTRVPLEGTRPNRRSPEVAPPPGAILGNRLLATQVQPAPQPPPAPARHFPAAGTFARFGFGRRGEESNNARR